MPTNTQRPAWFDTELFPYESNFVDINGSTVHYIDEGDGPTILMLHGNPTWSFLYRHLIGGLRDRFRCVALDYPGFGLSSAAGGYGFTSREHSATVELFVKELGLTDYTPFVQDWGGPIGLGVATRNPDQVKSVIVANTFAWPMTKAKQARYFSKLMGGPVGGVLVKRMNAFVNVLLPQGFRRNKPTKAVMAMYRGPFPTAESRVPVHVFPEQIIGATDFLEEVHDGLPKIADKPALILWGNKDLAFTDRDRQRWERTFTNSRSVILEGAGHFVQDDAHDLIIPAIRDWFPADA